MALRALQAEQDRWRVETHSLAYPGKALDDSGLKDWDDESSERVPPRHPTKTQRASQQMALAVTGLLSAKFQDKVAGLHGQELDAVLDAALLETELGRGAHNARDEVKTYLKQVLASLHGITFSPMQAGSAAAKEGLMAMTHAGAWSDTQLSATPDQQQGQLPAPHSGPAVTQGPASPAPPPNAPTPAPAPAAPAETLQPVPSASLAELPSGPQSGLWAQQSGTSVAHADQHMAAIISAAASAATTAAAALLAGGWGFSNRGEPPGPPTPGLASGMPEAGARQRSLGAGREPGWGPADRPGSPDPQPHHLDSRLVAAVQRHGQQQASQEWSTTALPTRSTLTSSTPGQPQLHRAHPSSAVRVTLLGGPRIRCRDPPSGASDSSSQGPQSGSQPPNPPSAELKAEASLTPADLAVPHFQDFKPGTYPDEQAPGPLPLPVMDPTSESMGLPHYAAVWPPRGQALPPAPSSPPPRPQAWPGLAPLHPMAAVIQPVSPGAMGATAADGTEGGALIRHEVVDSGLQHQAGCFGSFVQAATGAEAGESDSLGQAGTGSAEQINNPKQNSFYNGDSMQQLQQQQQQQGQEQQQQQQRPPQQLQYIQQQQGQQQHEQQQVREPWQPRPAQPHHPASIHQPVALPQELQAAMQRTLKVLAEPEAPLFPTAPWPPPRPPPALERQQAERAVHEQLAGPLDYGKLVQELEAARRTSLLLGRPWHTQRPPLANAANTTLAPLPTSLGQPLLQPAAAASSVEGITTQATPMPRGAEAASGAGGPAGRAAGGVGGQARGTAAGGGALGLTRTAAALRRLQARRPAADHDGPLSPAVAGADIAPTPAVSGPVDGLQAAAAAAGAEAGRRAGGGPGAAASAAAARSAADLDFSLPPVMALWDDDETWNDPVAYAEAVRREVAYRAASGVGAQAGRPPALPQPSQQAPTQGSGRPRPTAPAPAPRPAPEPLKLSIRGPTPAAANQALNTAPRPALPSSSAAEEGAARGAAALATAAAARARSEAQERARGLLPGEEARAAKVPLAFGRRAAPGGPPAGQLKQAGLMHQQAANRASPPRPSRALPRSALSAAAAAAVQALAAHQGLGHSSPSALQAALEAALDAQLQGQGQGQEGGRGKRLRGLHGQQGFDPRSPRPLPVHGQPSPAPQPQHRRRNRWQAGQSSRLLFAAPAGPGQQAPLHGNAATMRLEDDGGSPGNSPGQAASVFDSSDTLGLVMSALASVLAEDEDARSSIADSVVMQHVLAAASAAAAAEADRLGQHEGEGEEGEEEGVEGEEGKQSAMAHMGAPNSQLPTAAMVVSEAWQQVQVGGRPQFLLTQDVKAVRGNGQAVGPAAPSQLWQQQQLGQQQQGTQQQQGHMMQQQQQGNMMQRQQGHMMQQQQQGHMMQQQQQGLWQQGQGLGRSQDWRHTSSLPHTQQLLPPRQQPQQPPPLTSTQAPLIPGFPHPVPELLTQPLPPPQHSGQQQEELLSTTAPPLPPQPYGDAAVLAAAPAGPLHPAASTRLLSSAEGRQVLGQGQEGLMAQLVEEVLRKIMVQRLASQPGSRVQLPPGGPAPLPLLTNAHLSQQLVSEALAEQLSALMHPFSQQPLHPAPGPPHPAQPTAPPLPRDTAPGTHVTEGTQSGGGQGQPDMSRSSQQPSSSRSDCSGQQPDGETTPPHEAKVPQDRRVERSLDQALAAAGSSTQGERQGYQDMTSVQSTPAAARQSHQHAEAQPEVTHGSLVTPGPRPTSLHVSMSPGVQQAMLAAATAMALLGSPHIRHGIHPLPTHRSSSSTPGTQPRRLQQRTSTSSTPGGQHTVQDAETTAAAGVQPAGSSSRRAGGSSHRSPAPGSTEVQQAGEARGLQGPGSEQPAPAAGAGRGREEGAGPAALPAPHPPSAVGAGQHYSSTSGMWPGAAVPGPGQPPGYMQAVPGPLLTMQVPIPVPMPYYLAPGPCPPAGPTLSAWHQPPPQLAQPLMPSQPASSLAMSHSQQVEGSRGGWPSSFDVGAAASSRPEANPRAAESRPRFVLPGLDRILLDSVDLDSSSDSVALALAVQAALGARAAPAPDPTGPQPLHATPQYVDGGRLAGLRGHAGWRAGEELLLRSYPEASLEGLLAPPPQPLPQPQPYQQGSSPPAPAEAAHAASGASRSGASGAGAQRAGGWDMGHEEEEEEEEEEEGGEKGEALSSLDEAALAAMQFQVLAAESEASGCIGRLQGQGQGQLGGCAGEVQQGLEGRGMEAHGGEGQGEESGEGREGLQQPRPGSSEASQQQDQQRVAGSQGSAADQGQGERQGLTVSQGRGQHHRLPGAAYDTDPEQQNQDLGPKECSGVELQGGLPAVEEALRRHQSQRPLELSQGLDPVLEEESAPLLLGQHNSATSSAPPSAPRSLPAPAFATSPALKPKRPVSSQQQQPEALELGPVPSLDGYQGPMQRLWRPPTLSHLGGVSGGRALPSQEPEGRAWGSGLLSRGYEPDESTTSSWAAQSIGPASSVSAGESSDSVSSSLALSATFDTGPRARAQQMGRLDAAAVIAAAGGFDGPNFAGADAEVRVMPVTGGDRGGRMVGTAAAGANKDARLRAVNKQRLAGLAMRRKALLAELGVTGDALLQSMASSQDSTTSSSTL